MCKCASVRAGVVALWCQKYHDSFGSGIGKAGHYWLSLPTPSPFVCASCGDPVLYWTLVRCPSYVPVTDPSASTEGR